MRGLAFHGNYAAVGVSCPRAGSLEGLAFQEQMQRRNIEPGCGVMVVGLSAGKVVEWLQFEGVISEIFGVEVLAGAQHPVAVGFKTDSIARLITFPTEVNA